MQIRTDLAIEAHELLKDQNKQGVLNDGVDQTGIEVEDAGDEQIKITRVRVTTNEAAQNIGKPQGNYITIDVPGIREASQKLIEETQNHLSRELFNIIKLQQSDTVLVIGLGNWNITPDALGPKVISKLMITRHMEQEFPSDSKLRQVCAISPGVLGITGIETFEIVKGVLDRVHPNLIIVIDSLASRKMERISTTIQIADTGISPGSGVGNKRVEISEKTLGVKVVAIGVPTVVDAATMANDTIDYMIDSLLGVSAPGTEFYNMLKSLDKDTKYKMILEVLNPYVGNLIVTPKEIDEIITKMANIVASGINDALLRPRDSSFKQVVK